MKYITCDNPRPPPGPGASVYLPIQIKFQEYLGLSNWFLDAYVENGSSDVLPVVRMSSLLFRVDDHSATGLVVMYLW